MSYSLDFRRKVFEIKAKKGLTFEETSQYFNIGIRTLFRWKKKIEPCTTRNKPATKIDMDALLKDVELYPDAYQYERAERFGVTQRAIGFALKRLGISYKKNTKTSQSKRRCSYQISGKNE
ncbi:IS630 transposase-related protein [Pasteurella atlantica]|uniref:IS630 transposase-related protein n=1 Tax=Pasteurellaceae TaxID=712 RepID=UPI0027509CBB|nr:IS630 transposase-related protein [Pasteurella atlantica]MDP8034611.1 IS630 transposase-related protein [Pasteurella atlantica]MDP8036556.1 IS630 transposase-related protein [Pasteurella atlantica]MDP8038505.1 IS630 transposase-related protein [Pasteurella atlantica]MDP8048852.1 IS630 transposase-related protein [Pasteurella atlantica]MDP8050799.1 IS630 transposase-related protein [Pasteurella atlantica]